MWSAFLRAPSPSALEALADAVQVAEAVPIPPRAAFAPLLKALAAKSTHAAVVLRQVAEVADATHSRASAEPLRGCPGRPCALRTAPRLEFSTHMQYASTALFCDLGPAGRRPPPPVRGGARGRAARAAGGDRGGRAQAARLDAQRGRPDGAQPRRAHPGTAARGAARYATQGSSPGPAGFAHEHRPHATALQTGLLLTRLSLALDSAGGRARRA